MNYKVIAIEREYASGGTEIGEKLAARLGVPCYGKEILEKAAQKMGISIKELEDLEEKTTSSLLYSIYAMANISSGEVRMLTKEHELSITESEIIKNLVIGNPCVIVGRCAAGIFREDTSVLKVFIQSDMETRKERAVNVYRNDEKNADSLLKRFDKRRNEYYKATVGKDWRDMSSYHMILDSGKLGIDSVVDILETCAR